MRWAYGCTDLFEKAAVCRGAEFSTVGLDGTPRRAVSAPSIILRTRFIFSLRAEKNFAVNFFTTDKYRYWRIPGIKR